MGSEMKVAVTNAEAYVISCPVRRQLYLLLYCLFFSNSVIVPKDMSELAAMYVFSIHRSEIRNFPLLSPYYILYTQASHTAATL